MEGGREMERKCREDGKREREREGGINEREKNAP